MESQAARSLDEIKAAAHKNTVENLLLSLERKAKGNPEKAEDCEWWSICKCLERVSRAGWIFLKFFLLFILVIIEEVVSLSDLLGEVVDRALDLVDNTPVKLLRSQQTGRELFEIKGSGNQVYHFFPGLPYCNCRSFAQQVIKGEEYCCKHYIAARIARALGKVEVEEFPLLEFRKKLKFIQFWEWRRLSNNRICIGRSSTSRISEQKISRSLQR